MSILIKGYEMPESCRECPLEMYYMICGETRCRATNRLLASDFKTIDFEGRADDCPLSDVPDTNDGDIISRQAAKDYIDTQKGRPFIGCTIGEAMKIIIDEVHPAPERPEIIRCKECREFRRYIETDITFCDLTGTEVKECDFCSQAKKMEADNDTT